MSGVFRYRTVRAKMRRGWPIARRSVQIWRGVLMRRLALLFAAMTVVVFMAVPALAGSGSTSSSHSTAGEESQAAAAAAAWFTSQRLAPNGAIDPNAYAAAAAQAASLPRVGGAWTGRTNLAGPAGNDFPDPPQSIAPPHHSTTPRPRHPPAPA